jgi:hypothetical protein
VTTYLQDVRELQRQFAAEVAKAQAFTANLRTITVPDVMGHDILGALATLIQMLEDRDADNRSVEAEVERLEDAIANLRALVLP